LPLDMTPSFFIRVNYITKSAKEIEKPQTFLVLSCNEN